MSPLISRTHAAPLDVYIDRLCRHPGAVIWLTLLWVAALAMAIPRLTVTNDMRAYFSRDNPQLMAFERLENTFSHQDNLGFLVVPLEGDIYNARTLGLVQALTEFGWQMPFARRVTSLTNFQATRARGDDLLVGDVVADAAALDAQDLKRLRILVNGEPMLLGNLVAWDGSATYVDVALSLPDDDLGANDEVVDYARRHLEPLRAAYADHDIHIGGSAAFNVTLGDAVKRDLKSLVVISYAVISLGLLLLLRHWGGTLATLLVITLAIVATMGLFGWLELTLAAIAGFVPSVVMTIAVADAVHILSSFYYEARRGAAREQAVREALRINAMPVFITSLTTVIGVLTLNFSDSPPYRDLGNMIAAGVAFAFVLSMTFLPAVLLVMPVGHPRRGLALERFMGVFADWVIAHRRRLLLVVGAGVVIIAGFIPRNHLSERWHQYFDTTFEVGLVTERLDRSMSGPHALRYSLDTGIDDGINDPRYLAALDAFGDWYLQQPGVKHVSKLSDIIKRLHTNLHGDDPAYYQLPEDRALIAQYLLLFELSLPLGMGLEDTINVRRSATQFVVRVKKTDSEHLLALDRAARMWLGQSAPFIEPTEGTGIDMVFAHINHRNIRSLLQGMAVALLLISCLLLLVLRSVRLGLMSVLTNLAPAGLAYGVWGITAGWIDLSASVVMCMSLGIVVDDTVHFLSKYLRARRERGLAAADAMRYAFNTVGVALTITTAVLVAGFLVLAASHFSPTQTTGLLLAMTLSFALIVDFLFLPPLLLQVDRD